MTVKIIINWYINLNYVFISASGRVIALVGTMFDVLNTSSYYFREIDVWQMRFEF